MRFFYFFILSLILVFAHPIAADVTVEVLVDDDFESSTTTWVNLVRPDYDDTPSVVTSDADYPAAFPLPANLGAQVVRNADDDNSVFGLAAIHPDGSIATPSDPVYIDLFDAQFTSATVSADVYIDLTGGSSTERNVAMIAVQDDDVPALPTSDITTGEGYYRFGIRDDLGPAAYLQFFSAASGTEEFAPLARDTAIISSMTIPGWNNFRMEFDGAGNINCFINDVACAWNGTTSNGTRIQYITVGGLAFNLLSQNPILLDNAYLVQELTDSSDDLIISEVLEGAGNLKYIEIFSSGATAVDLDDADADIVLNRITNANDIDTSTSTDLSGTIPAGGRYVIANNATEFNTDTFGFDADAYTTFISHNGDDSYALVNNTDLTLIDGFALDRKSTLLTGAQRDQPFANDVVVFRVIGALPNDGSMGDDGGGNAVALNPSDTSPSGNWTALDANPDSEALNNGTPGFSGGGGGVEVPVELSVFGAE